MFKRLTVWQRLGLLAAAFLIPVVSLLYFLVREQNVAIDFARNELAGIEYFRGMRPLYANLLEHRDLRAALRAGATSRVEELARRTDATGESFAAAEDRGSRLSMPLESTKQLEPIRQMWADGARAERSSEAADTAVLEETMRHIVAVGNESKLVLDPDVDSYYCMDAVIFKLPKLLQELSDTRGQVAQLVSVSEAGAPDADGRGRESLQALGVTLREALVAMRDNIQFGFRFNPEVDRQLGPRFRELESRVDRIIAALAGAVRPAPSPEELSADITATINRTFATYDASMDTLEELLNLRIAGFEQRRFVSFSIVIPSLIAGLWIVVLLQREMEGRNQDLSRANDQLDHANKELGVAVEKYEVQAAELARSNSDLQQFAYVASHDLQEPLRIVSSYAHLFEERYKAHVDEKGQKWITYMVDAAQRMQRLIEDLLVYSRVDTTGKKASAVDTQKCVQEALANLRLAIERKGAEVTHDALPNVMADRQQLTQLFQNLVGNALKYCDDARPKVHIGGHDDGTHWRFSVRDNGIGIDPKFHDRIFGVFQRLHERGKYEGTGIGLAICKKIVERHGGRIWVESEQAKGATFHFTLPLAGPGERSVGASW